MHVGRHSAALSDVAGLRSERCHQHCKFLYHIYVRIPSMHILHLAQHFQWKFHSTLAVALLGSEL